jgi:nucleoid DNA-binding protein
MLNFLYKYLSLNKHVSVPGVGNFVVQDSPAKFNANTKSFSPPTTTINFQQSTALTDKSFYHFLAGEMGITDVEAVRKFQDFSYQLRKDIQNNSFVELTGIGTLKRNSMSEVVFEPSLSTAAYFPSITADEVVTAKADNDSEVYYEEEQEVVAKDNWWIWALVLGFVAIAAIVYFYLQANY